MKYIFAFIIAASSFIASANEPSANSRGAYNLSEKFSDCQHKEAVLTVKGVQFSEGAITIDIIQFIDNKDNIIAMPTNFKEIPINTQRAMANGMIKFDKKYTVSYILCGQGGYPSMVSIEKL